MKLFRAEKDRYLFVMPRREKRLLFEMLQLYPLVPPAHHQLSNTGEGKLQDENQRLLDDSLAEHRREKRRQVLNMLNEPTRFRESSEGMRLTLTPGEIEWLLQVLNDVRVGAWLALGKPEGSDDLPAVNETTAPYVLAMESAGYFQTAILDALGVNNPSPNQIE